MLRTKLTELVVQGFQVGGVELGFEAKMPDAALELEHLELGVGPHSGKEMRGLCFGGWLAHGRVLFERLLVLFRFPPSLVNRGQSGLVQVDIAADQI